ncbi:aminopeptidase P family protein [Rhodophyticola sp. CCM32]|uniref:M24 family metallopeptidase n=1 Tax=Rhodophyticola sp. CCM32 TaxID=2916397 RepID=UPI00107F446F|nr:Xaa-Pro peptidase family protein [Rhodophyticola sp. CCM32]QBY01357.1 aminopeptidase P family protein [Rhodophyticola sp. CCM32]
MVETAYWFEKREYDARLARVQAALRAGGLDGLIAFQPETVTWVTGYFTRGYGTLQFAIIPAEGLPAVFCRDVEEYYLDATCVYPDRAMWRDSDDRIAVAAEAIRARLGSTAKLGIEKAAWPLSVDRFDGLQAALPGCLWQDESDLVRQMRLIKSPAEIAYQRRAGKAAEAGMRAAIDSAAVGVSEREMAAEVCAAMIRAGSDLPGPGVMSSGERAFHLHGGYSDRVLEHGDIVQIETTPNVRHYHARFMRPIRVASAREEDHRVVENLIAIQDAALAEVAPGISARVPDTIYREGVLSAGLRETYTNKTFYSVGLLLQPSGGEPLEAAPGADWCFEPGMTFHTYVLARGFGMSETIAITETGSERLTNFPRQLFIAG